MRGLHAGLRLADVFLGCQPMLRLTGTLTGWTAEG